MAVAPAVGRAFFGPSRLAGVDLARGLAVIGMLAAHLIALPAWRWSDPATWGDIASGRSSILFATLAGVSLAVVSGGDAVLPPGPRLNRVRASIALRGAILWVLGLLLVMTGVPVYVILPAYGILFLLSIGFLRLRARTLWIVAAALALVMPWLQPVLNAMPVLQGEAGVDLQAMLGWHYPFPVWLAFVVAGMAAGRSDLGALPVQGRLLVAGALLAVIGYGLDGALGVTATTAESSYRSAVLTAAPHSSGLWEVIGSGGFALACLALCLLVCRARPVAAVLLPLRAVGSMPLTAYVGQIIAWALVAAVALGDSGDLIGMRALDPFWWFVAGTVVFCTAWAVLVGRGPLERVLAWVSRRLVTG